MSADSVKSNVEWKAWSELDPLYAVASWKGRERGGANPWTDEEFFAQGAQDWADFGALWKQYGCDRAACAEIGCGAGRLTRQLAKDFDVVHALDVSSSMLEYARQRDVGPNVEFYLSDGATIPLAARSVSAVFSTHVFQHFDSIEHGVAYFGEIARVLRPGGSLMIHLPIYQWPNMPWLYGTFYSLRHRIESQLAPLQRALIKRNLLRPIMRSTHYSTRFLFDSVRAVGFTRPQVTTIAVSSNGSLHSFVMASRAA